jgi:acetyltransferase EpsM
LVGGNASFGGAVVVEDYASIGVGSSIKPGVTIGKGAVVGVGAVVIKDVEPGTTVVGVPAKPI